jgi:hypothetical protein
MLDLTLNGSLILLGIHKNMQSEISPCEERDKHEELMKLLKNLQKKAEEYKKEYQGPTFYHKLEMVPDLRYSSHELIKHLPLPIAEYSNSKDVENIKNELGKLYWKLSQYVHEKPLATDTLGLAYRDIKYIYELPKPLHQERLKEYTELALETIDLIAFITLNMITRTLLEIHKDPRPRLLAIALECEAHYNDMIPRSHKILKEYFQGLEMNSSVDYQYILEKVAEFPLCRWARELLEGERGKILARLGTSNSS